MLLLAICCSVLLVSRAADACGPDAATALIAEAGDHGSDPASADEFGLPLRAVRAHPAPFRAAPLGRRDPRPDPASPPATPPPELR